VTSDPCESVQICGDFPTKRKPGWLARLLQRRVEMRLHHSAAQAKISIQHPEKTKETLAGVSAS
jgi:hypothetical protein